MPSDNGVERLAEAIADSMWRIEGNYHREGSCRPGSRFEKQTLEIVQARAAIRDVLRWVATHVEPAWPGPQVDRAQRDANQYGVDRMRQAIHALADSITPCQPPGRKVPDID